jgi:hypothetical protein
MFVHHNRIESLENILAWGCKHDPANESYIRKSTAVQNVVCALDANSKISKDFSINRNYELANFLAQNSLQLC